MTLRLTTLYIECHYGECHDLFIVMLNVVTPDGKLQSIESFFFRNLTKTSLIPFWSGILCIPVTIEVLSFLSKLKNWSLCRWTLNPVTNSIKHFWLNLTLLGYNGAENYWAIFIHSNLIPSICNEGCEPNPNYYSWVIMSSFLFLSTNIRQGLPETNTLA